jgi:hypothetical protein
MNENEVKPAMKCSKNLAAFLKEKNIFCWFFGRANNDKEIVYKYQTLTHDGYELWVLSY